MPIGPRPAVVIGGGLAGLAAARLLARRHAPVVVLERDRRPNVVSPEEAFTAWERPGVPQFRHSHAFLARLRVVLLAHFPDVLDRLRASGVREFGLDEIAPPGVALAPRPDDEDVVLLACRRSTFEWAPAERRRTPWDRAARRRHGRGARRRAG
jgi:glycine/D-amino acid oxidase-like deaminating enzyme